VEELEEIIDSMEGIGPDGGPLEGDNLAREARVRSAYLDWCKEYGKESDEARFQQFSSNYLEMEEFAKESGKEMGLNEFADCTEEEYAAMMDGNDAVKEAVKEAESAVKEAESAIKAADDEMSGKADTAAAAKAKEAAAKKAEEEDEAKKKAAEAVTAKNAEVEGKKKAAIDAKKKVEEDKKKAIAEKGTFRRKILSLKMSRN
jgi:hypothetical protein